MRGRVRLRLRQFTARREQAFAVIEIGGPSQPASQFLSGVPASQPISIREQEIREIPAR